MQKERAPLAGGAAVVEGAAAEFGLAVEFFDEARLAKSGEGRWVKAEIGAAKSRERREDNRTTDHGTTGPEDDRGQRAEVGGKSRK